MRAQTCGRRDWLGTFFARRGHHDVSGIVSVTSLHLVVSNFVSLAFPSRAGFLHSIGSPSMQLLNPNCAILGACHCACVPFVTDLSPRFLLYCCEHFLAYCSAPVPAARCLTFTMPPFSLLPVCFFPAAEPSASSVAPCPLHPSVLHVNCAHSSCLSAAAAHTDAADMAVSSSHALMLIAVKVCLATLSS